MEKMTTEKELLDRQRKKDSSFSEIFKKESLAIYWHPASLSHLGSLC